MIFGVGMAKGKDFTVVVSTAQLSNSFYELSSSMSKASKELKTLKEDFSVSDKLKQAWDVASSPNKVAVAFFGGLADSRVLYLDLGLSVYAFAELPKLYPNSTAVKVSDLEAQKYLYHIGDLSFHSKSTKGTYFWRVATPSGFVEEIDQAPMISWLQAEGVPPYRVDYY